MLTLLSGITCLVLTVVLFGRKLGELSLLQVLLGIIWSTSLVMFLIGSLLSLCVLIISRGWTKYFW